MKDSCKFGFEQVHIAKQELNFVMLSVMKLAQESDKWGKLHETKLCIKPEHNMKVTVFGLDKLPFGTA